MGKTPWGAIAGGATALIGMLGQRKREKRAMNNQKKLMNLQYANQRQLNQQGHNLQYDMWKKTNYPAQMEMMREAGLNPSLMYGMSGGGGQTTGSQGGGSAAGGTAPAPQPMELGTALQASMTAAQIENIKADTKLKEADATKTTTVDTEKTKSEIEVLQEEIKNKEVSRKLQNAQEAYTRILELKESGSVREFWRKLTYETDILEEQLTQAAQQSKIVKATTDDIIQQTKNEASLSYLQLELTQANIGKTKEEIKSIAESIQQKWVELSQGKEKVDIQAFAEEVKANNPTIMQAGGHMLNKIIIGLERLQESFIPIKLKREIKKNTPNKKGGW